VFYGARVQGQLRLDVEPAGDTTTVRVVGEADLATSPHLRERLSVMGMSDWFELEP